MHPDITTGIERAAGYLADAGYAVEAVEPPSIMAPAQGWFDIAVSEIVVTLGPLARQHGSDTIQRLFEYYQRLGNVVDAEGYRTGIASRTAYTREWNVFLADYPLVLTPFMMRALYPWDYDARGFDETRDLFMSSIYSCGINYLSLPAGVVPIGFADNLPAGVQIVGQRYREDLILDAMQAIESRVGILAHRLWARQ
jgi:amidase